MKIAIIGCGVMGSAFARHWAADHAIVLCDPHQEAAEALSKETRGTVCQKLEKLAEQADAILLAVKPKDLSSAAQVIAPTLTSDHLLISILAGTSLATLKHHFPTGVVIRTMPNLGFLHQAGVMGIVDDEALSLQTRKKVDLLLEGIGLKLWLSENKIEALTALSGSGIGFMFVIIEAMIDGGVHLGFTSAESTEIVLKTMEGAIALMRASGKHPAELKLQISSPGGTTIAGLRAMEEAGVRAGIFRTLIACYDRALEMRKELES
jgi:pyrroline-5-carboxylate reductase